MSVKIFITMVGLNAVVRRDQITYAVLPNTAAHEHQHDGEPMPPHVARLYLGPTQDTGGFPVGASLPIEGCVLRIRGRQSDAPQDEPLPDTLFDIFPVTQCDLAPETLAYRPSPRRVTARVDLLLRGIIVPERVAKYDVEIGGKMEEKFLASFVRWQGTVDDDDGLTLELVRFDAHGTPSAMEITPPRNADGSISLGIYHVPPNELPPKTTTDIEPGKEVFHFKAYYVLFDDPKAMSVPRLDCGGTRGTASGCDPITVVPT